MAPHPVRLSSLFLVARLVLAAALASVAGGDRSAFAEGEGSGGPAAAAPRLETETPSDSSAPRVVLTEPDGIQDGRLDFGGVAIGSDGTVAFEVRNTGGGILEVRVLPCTRPGFAWSTEPSALAQGEAAIVAVAFAPSALGEFTESLLLATNDPSAPVVAVSLPWSRVPLACAGGCP